MSDTVTLSIGPDRTMLMREHAGQRIDYMLPVGWASVAAGFQHVPTAAEIEQAIDVVEDEITGLRVSFAGSLLSTEDVRLRQVAAAAGLDVGKQVLLNADAVENVFTRMAAAASAALLSSDAIGGEKDLAAALLILRELMHHLGFHSITVRVPRGPGLDRAGAQG